MTCPTPFQISDAFGQGRVRVPKNLKIMGEMPDFFGTQPELDPSLIQHLSVKNQKRQSDLLLTRKDLNALVICMFAGTYTYIS